MKVIFRLSVSPAVNCSFAPKCWVGLRFRRPPASLESGDLPVWLSASLLISGGILFGRFRRLPRRPGVRGELTAVFRWESLGDSMGVAGLVTRLLQLLSYLTPFSLPANWEVLVSPCSLALFVSACNISLLIHVLSLYISSLGFWVFFTLSCTNRVK